MLPKKITIKKKSNFKKNLLQSIKNQLNSSLPTLKKQLSDKKFNKRVKKAAKLLIEGIKKNPVILRHSTKKLEVSRGKSRQ